MFVESKKHDWVLVGEGVRRKILGYDPKILMACVEFKKGAIGSLHKHPHTQVTYIEHGSFEVMIGDSKKVLTAGDCFYIPPDVEHGVVALEESRLVDVFTPVRDDFLKNN